MKHKNDHNLTKSGPIFHLEKVLQLGMSSIMLEYSRGQFYWMCGSIRDFTVFVKCVAYCVAGVGMITKKYKPCQEHRKVKSHKFCEKLLIF